MMNKRNGHKLPRPYMLLLLVGLMAVLVACSETAGDPSVTVERYMLAKVEGNETAIRQLICAELENQVNIEVMSFSSVDATIENMSCTSTDGSDVVSCTGEIKIDYGDEQNEAALTAYRVVQEDGEWKWCGEAEAQ